MRASTLGPRAPTHAFEGQGVLLFRLEHLSQKPVGALHKYIIPTAAMMSGDFTQLFGVPRLVELR